SIPVPKPAGRRGNAFPRGKSAPSRLTRAAIVRIAPHRVAEEARTARPAVAAYARSVPRLAFRDHAAANAGCDGDSVLPALPCRFSRCREPCRGTGRARARALERAWLLSAR